MTILDHQLTVAKEQALGNVGTVVCADVIDLGAPGSIPGIGGTPLKDLGRGNRKILLAQITETALASGGAATADFQVVSSDNADLSSPTVHATTGAIAKATLVAGYRIPLAIPLGITKRYFGVQWVVATNNFTAGKVHVSIVDTAQDAW